MVRYCVVKDCFESDKSILAHRFPKQLESRKKWQESLNLLDFDLELLYNKYVVCINHFKPSDYRNAISKHLNVTAVPECGTSNTNPQVPMTKNSPFRSTDIIEITDAQPSPIDPVTKAPVQTLEYETVFSQRRKKRTNEEVTTEIKELTKVALKKMKVKPTMQIISVESVSVVTDSNDGNKQDEQSREVQEVSDVFEVSCQTDEEKDESKYGSLSRTELLELLKNKDETIEALQTKLGQFEAAMATFNTLMNTVNK